MPSHPGSNVDHSRRKMSPYTILLGTAQDGGIPQPGCRRSCCKNLPATRHRLPCCLGLVDPESGSRWLIDCTPEFPRQLQRFDEQFRPEGDPPNAGLEGILLTHAHIGHYTGLVHLGTEVMATDRLPVFVMPKMKSFLKENEPWRRLIQQRNVELRDLAEGEQLRLSDQIGVQPVGVPHRDENSETVAMIVRGPHRALLYLPDIDGWDAWSTRIEDLIGTVDAAYLDGTFFDAYELPSPRRETVPHPRIADTLKRFSVLTLQERSKVHFLHFNHTNPAQRPDSEAAHLIGEAGMHIAQEMETCPL